MTHTEAVKSQEVIPILYEESHFMLVDKPAGLFTQAAPGVPSLEQTLIHQLKNRDQHPGSPFVGLPHRLDRATSGVLLVARNQRALGKFGQQFQSRKISKQYLALVQGVVPTGIHQWNDYLRKIPNVAKAELVTPDTEGARLAEMRIESIAQTSTQSLVVVELLTGRMHQIRLQAASRGFPVFGDQLYGGIGYDDLGADVTTVNVEHREQPQALHAYRLGYRHPQNAKLMTCTAPIPPWWKEWVQFDDEQLETAISQSVLLGQS